MLHEIHGLLAGNRMLIITILFIDKIHIYFHFHFDTVTWSAQYFLTWACAYHRCESLDRKASKMAESLRRLVNIGTFTVLQDKLERWLHNYHVSKRDQTLKLSLIPWILCSHVFDLTRFPLFQSRYLSENGCYDDFKCTDNAMPLFCAK